VIVRSKGSSVGARLAADLGDLVVHRAAVHGLPVHGQHDVTGEDAGLLGGCAGQRGDDHEPAGGIQLGAACEVLGVLDVADRHLRADAAE
jgi:hypothetical protein